MNSGSAARGYSRSANRDLQTHSKLLVVVIGEPLVTNPLSPVSYPLSPISPSQHLPYALLPICNTPLIDYILENFVGNGVSEVAILLNPESVTKVQAHLSGVRTVRGKPWTSSDSMKVNVLECMRDMHKLSDAINEIRQRNVVPQSGSFLIVPIDCISIFHNNLQDYFQKHLERARTIDKYAATLLCTSAKQNLNSTLYNVLVQGLERQKEAKQREETGSPNSMRGSVDVEIDYIMGCGRLRCRRIPSHPKGHHTMFVLDNNTGVVQYMSRLEANSEDAHEPPLITFSRKTQPSVRMDLVPTGLLFCCCEALALIDFHIRDIHGFLSMSLLGQAEIFGNVFGVLEVPTCHAIIEPVNSLETYIEANLDVCARRLFPLTRDSLFAEAQAKYAVPSSSSETVYMHTSAKALGPIDGPNVVVGDDVVVPASVQLIGTVVGKNVTFGEGCSLTGCVVLEGAQIGKCCNLKGSVIGCNAFIGDGIELTGCIIGHNCVFDRSTNGNGTPVANGSNPNPNGGNTSLSFHNQAAFNTELTLSDNQFEEPKDLTRLAPGVSYNIPNTYTTRGNSDDRQINESKRGHSLVGSRGKVIVDRYKDLVVDTSVLFTEDAVPKASSDDEVRSIDTEDDEFELFRNSVRKNVNVALYKPSHIEAAAYDMSTICLSEGHSYPELCEVVTELLMEHVLYIHADRGVEAALEGARSLFAQWCRPFYNTFLSKNGQMNLDAMVATLEGLSVAIRDTDCVLHNHAPQLLEILYNGCDDELYNQRGYCIVSGQGLIAFESAMIRRRQNLQKYAGFEAKRDTYTALNKPSPLLLASDDSSDDSSDDVSRDSREEGKVLAAAMCHNFIMGVKNFLKLAPGSSIRPAVHSESAPHKDLNRPDSSNYPGLVLISESSDDEDESD